MRYIDLPSQGDRFVSDYESVVESLKRLLFSEPEEWVNCPGYGLGLNMFLEEGVSQSFLLSETIKAAVRRWVPRVEVVEVLSVWEENELKVKVNFRVPEFNRDGSVEMGVTA